ncbi:MAG: thioredoxin [Candidatus Altimarinota bacterium]
MAEHITDANFDQEVVKSDVPVLVDFYAGWCGPCKMMAPTIDKLAEEYKGKFKIVKLDVESNETGNNLNVRSIPTLMFFKGGKVVDTLVGFKSEEVLRAKIAEIKG